MTAREQLQNAMEALREELYNGGSEDHPVFNRGIAIRQLIEWQDELNALPRQEGEDNE